MKLKNIGKIVVSSVVAAALFLTAVSPAGVASASEAKTDYLKDVTAKKHLTYYSDNSNEYLVAQFDLKNHDALNIDLNYFTGVLWIRFLLLVLLCHPWKNT